MEVQNEKAPQQVARLWLRIVTGILLFPVLVTGFTLASEAILLDYGVLSVIISLIAAVLVWIIVRRLPRRIAVILLIVSLVCDGFILMLSLRYEMSPILPAPPASAPPTPTPWPIPQPQPQPQASIPLFPWPPPTASAYYVLPDDFFRNQSTLGNVVGLILSALESNGYVERSFFGTEAGGVALVTRLERINEDGSSLPGPGRWPAGVQMPGAQNLYEFLRGLFFVDPGHYRVIVFIIQEQPFAQSGDRINYQDALVWLRTGVNILPPEIAARPFDGNHCTALIYEFASDGTSVHVVQSQLTGKQHLEKAGVLALFEKPN